MHTEFFLLSLLIAVVLFRFSLRVIGPSQCLVLFQNGQATKIVGTKGVIFLLPFVHTVKLVDTSSKSQAIPLFYDGWTQQTPLVRGRFEYYVREPVKAARSDEINKDVDNIVTTTLRKVLEDATIKQCLTEKATVERRALEIANLKSAGMGITFTSLLIDSFPRHRQLLLQITMMPYIVYWQIVEAVQ